MFAPSVTSPMTVEQVSKASPFPDHALSFAVPIQSSQRAITTFSSSFSSSFYRAHHTIPESHHSPSLICTRWRQRCSSTTDEGHSPCQTFFSKCRWLLSCLVCLAKSHCSVWVPLSILWPSWVPASSFASPSVDWWLCPSSFPHYLARHTVLGSQYKPEALSKCVGAGACEKKPLAAKVR
jgi:hypothetical protein